MKKSEIKVGGIYRARISGRFVDVRVDKIRETSGYSRNGSRQGTVFDVTNLATKRTTTFRSAAKFRGVAASVLPKFIGWKFRDGRVDCREYHLADEYSAQKTVLQQDANVIRVAGCKAVDQAAALAKFRKAWEDTDTVEPEEIQPPQHKIDAQDRHDEAKQVGANGPEGENGSDPTEASASEDSQTKTKLTTTPSIQENLTVPSIKPPAVSGGLTPTFGGLAATLKRAHEAEKKDGLKPTEEQAQILDSEPIKARTGILIIKAGAGTGKTATLKMIEEVLPGRGQYTAFNRSLVDESKTKFKKAQCSTAHGLAFQAVGKKFAHRLGGRRVRASEVAQRLGIGTLTITTGEHEKQLDAGFLASRMIGAIRKFCQSADKELTTRHFPYIDGLDMPGPDGKRGYTNNEKVRAHLLPFARTAWKDMTSPDGELPFEHGIYLKLFELNNPIIGADYLLVDESQDLSPVLLSIIEQQKCLRILVGDDSQQIYEFTGAINAMASFPDAPRLYLSQSFRFGPAIADVANSILESLQEPTELRLKGLPSIDSKVEEVAEPVAILCRTNAAAVAAVLNAFAEGKQPHLIGGSAEVLAFVRAALDLQDGKTTAHPELACFSSWTEVQEYVKADEGDDLKLMVKLIDAFGAKPIIEALNAMPAEKDADLVVSTAHKSKGREWDTVRLAADFPTNSKSDDSDRRLLYVAATRAKIGLDVSQCPFFTGEDALEIVKTTPTADAVQPAATTNGRPARTAPDGYSWAKDREHGWVVRGPKDAEVGEEVEVVRRNGSRSMERIIRAVREYPEANLYEVAG